MQEFKTITEHKVLTLAWHGLIAQYEKERDCAAKSGSPIAEARVDELASQLAEINSHILRLEGKA